MEDKDPEIEDAHWGSWVCAEPLRGPIRLLVDGAPQEYEAEHVLVQSHPSKDGRCSVLLIISDIQTASPYVHGQIRMRLPGGLISQITTQTGSVAQRHPYVLRLPRTVFGSQPFPVQLGPA